jgi:hypothetical protein
MLLRRHRCSTQVVGFPAGAAADPGQLPGAGGASGAHGTIMPRTGAWRAAGGRPAAWLWPRAYDLLASQ